MAVIATVSGLGPDGRPFAKDMNLDHLREAGDPSLSRWLDELIASGGAKITDAPQATASDFVPTTAVKAVPASAVMDRDATTTAGA